LGKLFSGKDFLPFYAKKNGGKLSQDDGLKEVAMPDRSQDHPCHKRNQKKNCQLGFHFSSL